MLDVLVIGAGVAGLTAARLLTARGLSFEVLEARSRTGGRAYSPDGVDLGPTWVWDSERSVHALLDELGVETQPHYDDGIDVYESQDGLQQGRFPRSMVASRRIVGGVQALTNALAKGVEVQLQTRVTGAEELAGGGLRVYTSRGPVDARNVLAALPPRLVSRWHPSLAELAQVPVWMGTIAKVVATFETPFWKQDGRSGRAASALGPMVELHDMSSSTESRLFGFVPMSSDDDTLEERVRAQLVRLFGRAPSQVQVQRWYREPETWFRHSEHDGLLGHPSLSTPRLGGRLHLISAETSTTSPGHIDGAVERAKHVVGSLS